MGNKQSSKKVRQILITGLPGTGKTTMIYKFKFGAGAVFNPGNAFFNIETISYKNIEFVIFPMDENDKVRPLWRHYYQNTHALIWMVDSNDKERMSISRRVLHNTVLMHEDMKDVVVLIMANKQDLPNALSPEEIQEALDMVYYSEISTDSLKLIAKETLIKMLPDSIMNIISSYTMEKECRPMHGKYIESIFTNKEFPSTLFTKELLGDKFQDVMDIVDHTICDYLPPYETELGSQTHCRVMPTCATSGDGLYDAMDWLSLTMQEVYQKKNCIIL